MAAGPQAEKVDKKQYEAIRIQTPELPKEPTTKFYLGIVKSSPLSYVTIAGTAFHRHIEPPKYKKGSGEQYRDRKAGQVVDLTERQVEKIKELVLRKAVRRTPTECYVVHAAPQKDGKGPRYTRQATDEPLAKHVYLVRLGNSKPEAEWLDADDGESPEPMAA